MSPYGAAKLYGEALCTAYYHSFGLPTAIFRFANVYGPYSLHKTSVVNRFFSRIYEGQPLEIFGDGLQTRDFVHARDVAQGLEKALRQSSDTCCGDRSFRLPPASKRRPRSGRNRFCD
jgi:UDP-glucose 4-epimerase